MPYSAHWTASECVAVKGTDVAGEIVLSSMSRRARNREPKLEKRQE